VSQVNLLPKEILERQTTRRNTAIVALVGGLLLLGVVGLSADGGQVLIARREAQALADSAAHAGAAYIVVQGHPPYWDDASHAAFTRINDERVVRRCVTAEILHSAFRRYGIRSDVAPPGTTGRALTGPRCVFAAVRLLTPPAIKGSPRDGSSAAVRHGRQALVGISSTCTRRTRDKSALRL